MTKQKKESKFQKELKDELKEKFKDCVILKNDPTQIQGFPDLTILYKDKWAILECKRSEKESKQPNQEYYIKQLNKMGYASFIFPENKEQVLNELKTKLKGDHD